MEKRTYIQPEMDTVVLPAEALMDPIALAGSSTGPGVGNSAPARAEEHETPYMF